MFFLCDRLFSETAITTVVPPIARKSESGNIGKISSSERQITISLIFVSINYLLLTTPYYLYFYLATLPYFDKTPKRHIDMHIVYGFNSITLLLANSSINFFIYMLFGQKFRKDLFGLFNKWLCIKWNLYGKLSCRHYLPMIFSCSKCPSGRSNSGLLRGRWGILTITTQKIVFCVSATSQQMSIPMERWTVQKITHAIRIAKYLNVSLIHKEQVFCVVQMISPYTTFSLWISLNFNYNVNENYCNVTLL